MLYWYLFEFRGHQNQASTRNRESRGWEWMPFSRVINGATSFRKPMYKRLAEEFGEYLEPRKV